MIIHASKAFSTHLKCQVSGPKRQVPHHSSLDSWSVDLFKLTKVGTYALVMNDASLSTIIIPLKGVRKFEDFFLSFIGHVTGFFDLHGVSFDPFNQSAIILPRSNRSLIGTMNDAKWLMQSRIERHADGGLEIDWDDIENYLNHVPYSRIDYDSPDKRLKKMIG